MEVEGIRMGGGEMDAAFGIEVQSWDDVQFSQWHWYGASLDAINAILADPAGYPEEFRHIPRAVPPEMHDSPLVWEWRKVLTRLDIYGGEKKKAYERDVYIPLDAALRAAVDQFKAPARERNISNGVCAECGEAAQFHCTGCRKVHYCGKIHQRSGWRLHKSECRRFEGEEGIKLLRDFCVDSKEIALYPSLASKRRKLATGEGGAVVEEEEVKGSSAYKSIDGTGTAQKGSPNRSLNDEEDATDDVVMEDAMVAVPEGLPDEGTGATMDIENGTGRQDELQDESKDGKRCSRRSGGRGDERKSIYYEKGDNGLDKILDEYERERGGYLAAEDGYYSNATDADDLDEEEKSDDESDDELLDEDAVPGGSLGEETGATIDEGRKGSRDHVAPSTASTSRNTSTATGSTGSPINELFDGKDVARKGSRVHELLAGSSDPGLDCGKDATGATRKELDAGKDVARKGSRVHESKDVMQGRKGSPVLELDDRNGIAREGLQVYESNDAKIHAQKSSPDELNDAVMEETGDGDIIHVFRLCGPEESNVSKGIVAKDPSNTSCSAVEHINDGAAESQWISCSFDPVACLFYASEAAHKRGIDLTHLCFVEIKLDRNDPAVFDLSGSDAVSLRHRRALAVDDDGRARNSTRLFGEVLVKCSIDESAVVQTLRIPPLEYLPISANFSDFREQFDFNFDWFERERRMGKGSDGPRVGPCTDIESQRQWLLGMLSQERVNAMPTLQGTLRDVASLLGVTVSAASTGVRGDTQARISSLLTADSDVTSLDARGELPSGNFVLRQGIDELIVCSEPDDPFVVGHLSDTVDRICEEYPNSIVKAGFCLIGNAGTRTRCSFTYPAKLFDRDKAWYLDVVACNKRSAEKIEGVLIHLIDMKKRLANKRWEWEGTHAGLMASGSLGVFYCAIVRKEFSLVSNVSQSSYFAELQILQDKRRDVAGRPRFANGRLVPMNSCTGQYGSNINLDEGRRGTGASSEDLLEILAENCEFAVLHYVFGLSSGGRLNQLISDNDLGDELGVRVLDTSRFQRLKAHFERAYANEIAGAEAPLRWSGARYTPRLDVLAKKLFPIIRSYCEQGLSKVESEVLAVLVDEPTKVDSVVIRALNTLRDLPTHKKLCLTCPNGVIWTGDIGVIVNAKDGASLEEARNGAQEEARVLVKGFAEHFPRENRERIKDSLRRLLGRVSEHDFDNMPANGEVICRILVDGEPGAIIHKFGSLKRATRSPLVGQQLPSDGNIAIKKEHVRNAPNGQLHIPKRDTCIELYSPSTLRMKYANIDVPEDDEENAHTRVLKARKDANKVICRRVVNGRPGAVFHKFSSLKTAKKSSLVGEQAVIGGERIKMTKPLLSEQGTLYMPAAKNVCIEFYSLTKHGGLYSDIEVPEN